MEGMDFEPVQGAKIKVIGIGGAGGNAVNNMIKANLEGVEFVAANTDIQDLKRSICLSQVQLGASITKGLGAGADPEIGKAAAEESLSEVRDLITGSDMIFLAAGMGGGTGTGATPVIARECKESGVLTIAVVTKPFAFEGEKRMIRALAGIDSLKKEADTIILIPNERLRSIGNRSSAFKDLIARADDVLLNAVKGISDLIVSSGFINLDFADVKKVMGQMGTAIMGTGRAVGENRALDAAKEAVNSPLLEDISISGAKGLLMNICGPPSMTMEEIDEACNYIKGEVDKEADIFWGVVFDEDIGEEIRITVIASGIDKEKHGKTVRLRDPAPEEIRESWLVRESEREDQDLLDSPTYRRQKLGRGALPPPKQKSRFLTSNF
ncbi:MAG: cell division protein FtsZ [Desulfobacteraceae bacterium]|nr:MAG: cell division protein FtsZ [Desulfobacteraceae bacterium]